MGNTLTTPEKPIKDSSIQFASIYGYKIKNDSLKIGWVLQTSVNQYILNINPYMEATIEEWIYNQLELKKNPIWKDYIFHTETSHIPINNRLVIDKLNKQYNVDVSV